MYCIECGTKLPSEAKFCFKCGKKQEYIIVGEVNSSSTTDKSNVSKNFRGGPELNSTNPKEQFSFSRSNENYDGDIFSDLLEFLKKEGYGDIPIPSLQKDTDTWTHKMVEPGSGCGWDAYVCHPIIIYCNSDLPFSYDLTVHNEQHPLHSSNWVEVVNWYKPFQLKRDDDLPF